ncbi:Na+/H+ antiporter subunit E [bacterium]|nr:Na+/H+ antiporter subunit E [bacterium]
MRNIRKILMKIPRVFGFLFFYLKEVVLSNMRVAHDVLTPRHRMRPGVVAIPLDAETELEISAFANLITMTPGTLSLDVSSDKRVLYVHAMYIDDRKKLQLETKEGFEKKILGLFR